MQVSTLRPGFLVSLKTSLSGNVKYVKQVLDSPHIAPTGAQKARWETERTIYDPVEHEAAVKARTAARGAITRVCVSSAFGLLCPEDRAGELESAMAAARSIAEQFNNGASHTRLNVYIIPGRIAADDKEAILALQSEIRDLIESMVEGVTSLDAAAIREAANKAQTLGPMLTPEMMARVQSAIDTARSAARKIKLNKDRDAIEADRVALQRKVEATFINVESGQSSLNLDAIEAALAAKL